MTKQLYVHSGKGVWIGSTVIVMAYSLKEAEQAVKCQLVIIGLPDVSALDTVRHGRSDILYSDNGDY